MRIFAVSVVFLVFSAVPAVAQPCKAPFYLLFHEDARRLLDSLREFGDSSSYFEQAVLMHNLAFNKDKNSLKQAEIIFKNTFLGKQHDDPLVIAYRESLVMIKISQRSKASGILHSIFGKSPYKEAREAFGLISRALENNQQSEIIRFLRASAAVESAKYLPEFLDSARQDLVWLEKNMDYSQSAKLFYLHLTWGKYFYGRALHVRALSEREKLLDKALAQVLEADKLVNCEVYCRESYIWQQKIRVLAKKKEKK